MSASWTGYWTWYFIDLDPDSNARITNEIFQWILVEFYVGGLMIFLFVIFVWIAVGERGAPEGWRDQENRRLRLSWREACGRAVSTPKFRVCKTSRRKVWAIVRSPVAKLHTAIFDHRIDRQQRRGFLVV